MHKERLLINSRLKEEDEMLQMKGLFSAMLFALVAVCTPSMAQDSGWYAGVGLGSSKAKGACDGVTGPGISCDDTDMAYKIFGGYQINKNFAAEFGYTDLGKAEASVSGFGSASIKATGFEVVGVGIMPINPQWSVYGKLGFFRWDAKLDDGTGLIGSASASGTDLTYGVGVGWNLSKNVALRAEYQQYNNVGDEETTGQADVSVMGINGIFRF